MANLYNSLAYGMPSSPALTDPAAFKQKQLDQYTGIMSKYLPEGRATMASSPVFQKGYEMYDPSSFGSQITAAVLPASGKLGLSLNLPGSTGMYLPSKEEVIESAGGKIPKGELDWAETFGHETSHLGWQYEPKKIGSVFGKDINIPGEFGALSVGGKGGEEKWNYLHDLMYGSGALMKEKDKRFKEYMEMEVKGPPSIRSSRDEIQKLYDNLMPYWDSSGLGHLKGITDPEETDVTGKLINPGDWSYTPQAFHDVGTSGLISEHKKAIGFGQNPFEDTRAAGQWNQIQQQQKKRNQILAWQKMKQKQLAPPGVFPGGYVSAADVAKKKAATDAAAASQRREGRGGTHMSRSRDQGGLGISQSQAQAVSDANRAAGMSGWGLARGGRASYFNGGLASLYRHGGF